MDVIVVDVDTRGADRGVAPNGPSSPSVEHSRIGTCGAKEQSPATVRDEVVNVDADGGETEGVEAVDGALAADAENAENAAADAENAENAAAGRSAGSRDTETASD